MELLRKLKDQGWYLTEDGLKKLSDASALSSATTDLKKIIATAMDFDFREIAGGALPTELSKKEDTITGKCVLQVQKIRNISAPKANEESKAAPRLLQVDFSDGTTIIQALELEHISVLSLNTPPGTKVYFKPDRVQLMQGIIVLRASEVQLLGGKVAALYEKWEMTRTLQKYARLGQRMSGASGPPPWIPFGKRLENKDNFPNDRNFKSLSQTVAGGDKDGKENNEFNAMRNEAIAEAAKAGTKKVFGGGNQQIVDHNLKKILDKGYSEEEANNALRLTGNNLERALYNLKRREEFQHREDKERTSKSTAPMGGKPSRASGRRGEGRGGIDAAKEDLTVAAKPASNVSLFDFLTDKLPANSEATATQPTATVSVSHNQHLSSQLSHNNNTFIAVSNSTSNSKVDKSNKSSGDTLKPPFKAGRSNGGYQDRNQQQESRSNSKAHPQQQQHDPPEKSSQPKFENNLSSSFAANRITPNPFRINRDHHSSGNDRAFNRYSNSGQGGRGGGRGGGNAYHSGGRQYDDNTDRGFHQRGLNENNHRNNSSNAYNNNSNNNRNNRSSHERSTPAVNNSNQNAYSTSTDNNRGERNQNSTSVGYENRRSNDYSQHPQSDKNAAYNEKSSNEKEVSRNALKENSNSNYQGNNSRSGNNTNSNNAAGGTNSNDNHTSRMNKLVESTSKMVIDKTRSGPSPRNQQQIPQLPEQPQSNQQYSHLQQAAASSLQQQQSSPTVHFGAQQQHLNLNAPAAQHQQPQHNHTQPQPHHLMQPSNNFSLLPNGFTYDPSKIIGFQNKETNEFALTLLKSQGIPTTSVAPGNAENASMLMQQSLMSQYVSTAPSPMQMNPQPLTSSQFAISTPSGPPQVAPVNPTTFGTVSGENWMWKIGDPCLAKYWDDGRFYEAEITGISDKTCVVLFIGYGNHEEVLKSDCLPKTDAHNRPINSTTTSQQQQPISMQIPPPPSPASVLSRGVPNRYRGERQMYVPPPKREK